MIETIVDELIFFPLANGHIIFRKSLISELNNLFGTSQYIYTLVATYILSLSKSARGR